MTCATPRSVHTSRRHYGCPFSRTPRADDGRLVPAGLLACSSSASLPPSRRDRPGSGTWGDARRLQLRGQPRLREEPSLPAFPFHLQHPTGVAAETVTHVQRSKPHLCLSTSGLQLARLCLLRVTAAHLSQSPGAHRPTSEPISAAAADAVLR